MNKRILFLFPLMLLVGFLFAGKEDASDARLNRLTNAYEYYFFQMRTQKDISDKRKQGYAKKLKELEHQIVQLERAKKPVISKEKSTLDSITIIRTIIDLMPESRPTYAHENRSSLINLGTSFAGFSFIQPIYASFEQSMLGDKISIGAYGSFFTERKKFSEPDYKEYTSYTYTNQIYKYNYLSFGIKCSYHLLNLEPFHFGLNPVLYDLYATAVAGYSMAFLKTGLANNTIPYEAAQKEGINVGAMVGIRYFHDDHISVFFEGGYSRISYLTLGFGYRILPTAVSKNAESN